MIIFNGGVLQLHAGSDAPPAMNKSRGGGGGEAPTPWVFFPSSDLIVTVPYAG